MTDAVLVLEDGRTFTGRPYGAEGSTLGEIVFNTGMTGYQETLTDPSYHRQIVVMTAPHIGNTGVNDEDQESAQIWVAGYVVRDPARRASNWRSVRTLDDDLVAQGIVGISEIDTRALTRHLRERGVMRAGHLLRRRADRRGRRAPARRRAARRGAGPRPRWPARTWPARSPPTSRTSSRRSARTVRRWRRRSPRSPRSTWASRP